MTPTATELLSDPKFLQRRIYEQMEYMQRYKNYVTLNYNSSPGYYKDRQDLVLSSAYHQIWHYRELLQKLQSV